MLAGLCVIHAFLAVVTAISLNVPSPVALGQPFVVKWNLAPGDSPSFALFLAGDDHQTLNPLTTVDHADSKTQVSVQVPPGTQPGTYRVEVFPSDTKTTPEFGSGGSTSSSKFEIEAAAAGAANNSDSHPDHDHDSDLPTPSKSDTSSPPATSSSLASETPTTVSKDSLTKSSSSSKSPTSRVDSSLNKLTSSASSSSSQNTTVGASSTIDASAIGASSTESLDTNAISSSASLPATTSNTPLPANVGATSKSKMPMVVGSIFGGLLGLVLLASLSFFLIRRARLRRQRDTIKFYRERMVRTEISSPVPIPKGRESVIEIDFHEENSPSIYSQDGVEKRFSEV